MLAGHQFLDEELDLMPSQEKKSNKMNFRMFNFSKMVPRNQEAREIRILKQPIPNHNYSRSLQI
jgi:hypothetical protein